MITQLNPPIPLYVSGKGAGVAILVTDYGFDWDFQWTIILNDTGEIWTVRNSQVRGVENETMGRAASS